MSDKDATELEGIEFFPCNLAGCDLESRWVTVRSGTYVRMHTDGKPLHSWERETFRPAKKWWELWK